MKKIIFFIFCFMFIHFSFIDTSKATDFIKFDDNIKTLDNICSEMSDTNTKISSYVSKKFGIKDYKKGPFKYKLCGSETQNCYASRNEKYFISDQKFLSKQGEFYFGLQQNDDAKLIISSIGQCESNFTPTAKSPDGGYGVFQLTPAAIGDKKIIVSKLFDLEYNTQYAVYMMNNNWKYVNKTYKPVLEQNQNFYQYLALRGYNGGFKQINRIVDNHSIKDPYQFLFSGDYISASELSGRMVCFEKVNTVYPLKVYTTFEYLKQKNFGALK